MIDIILWHVKQKCSPRQNLDPIGFYLPTMFRSCCWEKELYRLRKTVLQEIWAGDYLSAREREKKILMRGIKCSNQTCPSTAIYFIILFFFWKGAISFLCTFLCLDTVTTFFPAVQKSEFWETWLKTGRNYSDLCHEFLAWTSVPTQKPTNFRWTMSGSGPVVFTVDWSIQLSWEENPREIISDS